MNNQGTFSMRTTLIAVVALIAALALPGQAARAQQPVVADLSTHLVAITTGFAGTDVLMFGATDGPGDVVMVLRGPTREENVRRKGREFMGLWVNKDEVTFSGVPSFYYVAASAPIDEIVTEQARQRHAIGADYLDYALKDTNAPEGDLAQFKKALVRRKIDQGLYAAETGAVSMLGNRLFRAELNFPANVPTGVYSVEVYLVRDGDVVAAEITPLTISKVGVGAEVYDFAYDYAAIYGIIAIIVAIFAGWLAGVAFRKG